MPSFADALGIHPTTVALRARRAEVLAANIANADTPGYQARDIDFRAVLGAAGEAGRLATTHAGHLSSSAAANGGELQYRQPLHASLDQ